MGECERGGAREIHPIGSFRVSQGEGWRCCTVFPGKGSHPSPFTLLTKCVSSGHMIEMFAKSHDFVSNI